MNSTKNSTLVNSQFLAATGQPNHELVCYIAGFGTKIKLYKSAIQQLQKLGYDVLAFDYDEAILRAGKPEILIAVIDKITDTVEHKSRQYDQVICMGVSLGSFISLHVQQRVKKAKIGAYAAGGAHLVPVLFGTRSFAKIGQTFKDNGYDQAKLSQAWQSTLADPTEMVFSPDKSFIAFGGTADKLVNFETVKTNVTKWQQRGIRVKFYPVPRKGHFLTAVYYVRHTKDIIAKAKQHHQQTEQ